MAYISKIYQVSDEQFIDIINKANSFSDCLRAFGLSTNGGSSTDVLKRRIRELGCDISHFDSKRKFVSQVRYSLDEILIENSTYTNISRLKERLIKEGRLNYICQNCGIKEWQSKPLSLHLDHINGKNNDHRIENLRFLCPNCHSQTDTYAGKNNKSKSKT